MDVCRDFVGFLLQAFRFGGAIPRVQARGESNRGAKGLHGLHSNYCFVSRCVSHTVTPEAKIKETEAELAKLLSDHKE